MKLNLKKNWTSIPRLVVPVKLQELKGATVLNWGPFTTIEWGARIVTIICYILFKRTWEIWNEQPKLSDEEAMETVRKGLEEKMSQDIDNMVCIGGLNVIVNFTVSFSDLRIWIVKHCMTRPGQLDVHVLLLHVPVVSLVNVHKLWIIIQQKCYNHVITVINVIYNKANCFLWKPSILLRAMKRILFHKRVSLAPITSQTYHNVKSNIEFLFPQKIPVY